MKFRVWNNIEKNMHYHYDVFCAAVNGNGWSVGECCHGDIMEKCSEEDGSILMISSGIKDINDEEIYEGDIVVQHPYENLYKGDPRVHFVVFRKGCFWVISVTTTHDSNLVYDRLLFTFDKLKVTGNIYEKGEKHDCT